MRKIIQVFLISKVILLSWFLLLPFIHLPLDSSTYEGVEGVLNPFTAFDSEHYLWIAEYGYSMENDHLFAFFPLYPFLIKILSFTGFSYSLSGILISWLSSFGVAVLLYKLLPEEKRMSGVWIWFLSPIAIFLSSVYTESLYVFLTLCSWYFVKEKKHLYAGLFLGLSFLTRNVTIILVIAVLIEMFANKRFVADYLKIIIPAGLIGSLYPFYLLLTTGKPFIFISVQEKWYREKTLPWEAITKDVGLLFNNSGYELMIAFNLISLIIVILLTFIFIKNQFPLVLFMLGATLVPLFASANIGDMPSTTSLVRYVWGLFPIYLLLAHINWTKRKKLYGSALLLFLMGSIALLFVLKKFIA